MSHSTNHNPRILLAEDDPDQSDSLRDYFERAGYSVDTAFSGDVALRRLSENHYNAAIMDLRMPGLNGGTVLKICRLKNPPSETPVIMLSAFATEHDRKQFLKDGASAVFAKPCDFDTLLAKLKELTNKQATT